VNFKAAVLIIRAAVFFIDLNFCFVFLLLLRLQKNEANKKITGSIKFGWDIFLPHLFPGISCIYSPQAS
jgi:hypothetical protein